MRSASPDAGASGGEVLVKVHGHGVSALAGRRSPRGHRPEYPPEAIVDAYRYVEAGQKTRIV